MRGARAILLTFLVAAGTVSLSDLGRPAAAWNNVSTYQSGLDNPVALAFAPAPDGRIFFAERLTGRIRIIENGTLLPDPFYALANTSNSGERGLLGLALDPAWASSPFVYAYQTFDDGPNGIVNRIVRIHANGNSGDSLSEIFRTPRLSAATIHNGGVIAFGPDGKLYAVIGENADPSHSQDPRSPMGKVLRMNPNGTPPTDNPFYSNSSWEPRVYSYGHRNMFGIAFHPVTGGIFLTENGPACNDEINLLQPGRNYGWGPSQSCTSPPDINTTNVDGPSPVLPIWWWDSTICPTNAAIYDGPKFPAWRGDLIMGDCNYARIHRLHLSRPNYTTVEYDESIWVAPDAILDLEAGPDGAVWFTTPSTIYRLWDSGVPPNANFSANPDPVVVGNPVQFNGTGSSDPDGTIVGYAWDFGDGATDESGPLPTHIYRAPGRYTVVLRVTDNESYSATYSQGLAVNPPPRTPIANFTLHPSTVAPDSPVAFDASDSTDPDGRIESYRWDFGDATGGSGIQTNHSYPTPGFYTVTLTVTDNDNLSGTTTRRVLVSFAPIAAIAVVPATIFIGTEAQFSGADSSDPDGWIQNWTWDFGDHSTAMGPQVTHRYAAKGRFTVVLAVEDNHGLTNQTHIVIEVRNRAPIIASTMPASGPVSLAEGMSQTFAVNASDPDGDALTYVWRTDGIEVAGSGPTLNFVPHGVGVYRVNVTVSDGTDMGFREWTVTVSAAVAPSDNLWTGLVSVAVVLAAIGGAVAVASWRRRNRGRRSRDRT